MNVQTAKDLTDRARFHNGDWLHIDKKIEQAASKGLDTVRIEGGMHETQVAHLKAKGFNVVHIVLGESVAAYVHW